MALATIALARTHSSLSWQTPCSFCGYLADPTTSCTLTQSKGCATFCCAFFDGSKFKSVSDSKADQGENDVISYLQHKWLLAYADLNNVAEISACETSPHCRNVTWTRKNESQPGFDRYTYFVVLLRHFYGMKDCQEAVIRLLRVAYNITSLSTVKPI